MACTNITIRQNTIHDSYGELIYIGGGAITNTYLDEGAGYPSHNYILIESNILYNGGIWGGQGDGIDVKGGIDFLTIRANTIYGLTNGTVRGIVMQGQYPTNGANQTRIVERNTIRDCTAIEDAAIVLINSWGTPQGCTIRNNLIYNINRTGGQYGIKIYKTQDSIKVFNNTIVNCSGAAVQLAADGSAVFTNNLFALNNGNGSQVSFIGATTNDYNAFTGTWTDAGANSVSLTTNQFNSCVTVGYSLKLNTLINGNGFTVLTFADDINGVTRIAPWDIGAYEYVSPAIYFPFRKP